MNAPLIECLANEYRLHGTLTELYGYLDANYLLTLKDGGKRVVKSMHKDCDEQDIVMQCHILDHLSDASGSPVPRLYSTHSGQSYCTYRDDSGSPRICWVLGYISGTIAASLRPHMRDCLYDLGSCVAKLNRNMRDIKQERLEREFRWKLSGSDWVLPHVGPLKRHHKKYGEWFTATAQQITQHILPALKQLPTQAIHGDLNDHNIILNDAQRVSGLIDFGDCHYAARVCDLAITATYFMMNKPQPLQALAALVSGYHDSDPLGDAEIDLIYPLIKMRLLQSLTHSFLAQQGQSPDDYITISELPALNLIDQLQQFRDGFIREWNYQACGRSSLSAKLARLKTTLSEQSPAPLMHLDMHSAEVWNLAPDSGLPADPFSGDMGNPLAGKTGKAVALGRYGEPRLIYQAPEFRSGDHPIDDTRTVHAGVDVFTAADTPISAPMDGFVHALKYHSAAQDYGPVVVLRHQLGDDTFYTLYGHLRMDCLETLRTGELIRRGQPFCHVGSPSENGGWAPHLHFQWVMEDLGWGTDIPGVAHAWNWSVWKSFFPNPAVFLGIDETAIESQTEDNDSLVKRRRKLLGKNLSIAYTQPLHIVRGWQQYLFDQNGRCFLDAYNNVPHVGHCHPRVVAATTRALKTLNTNTRYLHRTILDYAEALTEKFEDPLSVCLFVNSASEANELALRMARAHTGAKDMIVMDGAYHGHTTSLIDISPYKADGPGGDGCPDWVHKVALADLYRGAFRYGDVRAGASYAQEIGQVVEQLQSDGRSLCAFICESLPSVGGQLVLPEGYLRDVYARVRAAGGVCIADEVQTGFGRTGDYYWGFQQQQVTPDIVVLGKPMGNGQPLGAVITTSAIAESFDTGMEFFSTYGGNTVSCAAGLEVLRIIDEENIQAHVKKTGDFLKVALESVTHDHPMIGDVRGLGLFLGVDIVSNTTTREPATAAARHIKNRLREFGILTGTDGLCDNVLKIRPPTPFNTDDATRLAETLGIILKDSLLSS